MSAGNRWARLGIGARVVLAVALALGAAFLAVDLADWRYVRVDLTAARSNTLDPAVLDVIDKLPEPVVVDAFFRPLARPYDALSREAQDRVLEFLAVVRNTRREKIEVRLHDPQDFEAIQQRQQELNTEGTNKLVLSCGPRRDELELFGELCSVDWGNPSEEFARYLTAQGIPGVVNPRTWQPLRGFRPAALQAFRGEELFLQALLKVSSARSPKLYFSTGHGEPGLEGTKPEDLSRLCRALERDGFEVATWDALKEPAVPADCEVLALIGAKQAFQPATRTAIQTYTEGGGRLVCAPDLFELNEEQSGGIVDVLRGFGITTRPGLVCQALVGLGGEEVEGNEQCAWLVIDERGLQPSHPLTEPLRLRGRRVQFTFSASFDDSFPGEAGLVLPLVTSALESWRDLKPYDFRCNPAQGERRGRHTLITTKELKSTKAADGSVKRGRVLAIASAFFFDNDSIDVNRDFALNAFNWLAEREYRISVSPLAKSTSFLDFQRSSARPTLTYTLWLALPGVCAAIGFLIFLRRRS
jgi:hypothetical protein